ncbi:MAG: alpha/beta fold hydrolase, partial [Actinomycetota bacterium]|nr:alpha/beta fold hydrolase [Actinomycetota bacterium]
MSERLLVSASEEIPVFFPAGGETLFGILTRPVGEPKGVGVVLLAVRATFHRNRVAVLLARRLAGLGFHVLRFDYHGLADSSGTATFHLDQPFVEDVEGAVRRMRQEGVERFVLVGQCFGARTALAAAARLDGIAGVVLVALPVLDWSG